MPPHILVVDDEPAVAQGIAMLLEQAGLSTRTAFTTAHAQSLLQQTTDLVVLDVMLPDGDGFTFCRHIRQLPHYIPILMLTARDDLDDKVLGLELGADDYVTKPFVTRELIARIHALLRFAMHKTTADTSQEVPLVCGPVTLWPIQRRVEVQGRLIEVTPKEWALLELWVQHPGQAFGRETLLQRVWGSDFLGDSRVVDVHVQRLRAKLEANPSTPRCIQTIRSFGYRFAPPETSPPI